MYDSIDIEQLKEIQIEGNLIDLRDKYEFLLGHIPGAINIPVNYLFMNPENYLKKEKKYYLYCNYGSMSRKIVMELNQEGYQVIDLLGGYEKYLRKK